ncbi:MAG: insulinase family protein [Spirosomataceae bacterium]
MKRFHMYFIACFFVSIVGAFAQSVNWTAPLPNDPTVKVGKLKNGISYYIRKNVEPKNRMELRLALNVGAILENDDQQGLAHFMEHMNFNGTKNFPKTSIVDFLQRSGLKFGADLNASTGIEETVYQLQVPTDSVKLFNNAFQILEDWAHNATLDHGEIDKERGVVIEELRLRGKNAQQRLQEKWLPIAVNGARHATRLPGGKEEIIQNFKYEVLEQFYKDWYRPDLMAVIAVGDFDMAEVEKIIQDKFGSIPVVKNPRKRDAYPIPPHKDTKVAILTDKEFPQTQVLMFSKQPQRLNKTLKDYRESIAVNLINTMLGNRLQELTQKADPPFLFALGQYGGFVGTVDVFQNVILAKNVDGLEKAMKATLDENVRAQKFGFTASELDRAKSNYMTGVEKQFKEKDKTKSASFVNSYVNNFLRGSAFTSIDFRYEFAQKYLKDISIEEINALTKQLISPENRVAIVIAPEKDKDKLPSDATVLDWITNAGKDVKAYEDNAANKPLLSKIPTGTKVVAEKKVAEVGVTELTLGNGVKVVLKPTDFKNDQILFSAQSFGGTSLYSDADYESASNADQVVTMGGVGEFSSVQLEKMMTGKVVNVSPFVGENTEGMEGSTSPKDLETALQLVYAYFTQPRKDADVVKGQMTSFREYIRNSMLTPTPEKVFGDTVAVTLGNNNYRRMPVTPEKIDKVNLDRAIEIYKERFGDASDFTFFFVGNFKVDEIKPLLEKYLGGLPSINRKESFKDLGIRIPKGQISKTVYKGLEDKSTVRLIFSGDFDYNADNQYQLQALTEVLDIKLIERLREEESGVYSPQVSGGGDKIPSGRYSIQVAFGCAPKNVEKLIAATLDEINKIKQNGAQQKDIDKYKAETRRDTEVQLKENSFWLNYLSDQYENGSELTEVLKENQYLDKITVSSTKEAANKYFGSNFARFVLLPEKK